MERYGMDAYVRVLEALNPLRVLQEQMARYLKPQMLALDQVNALRGTHLLFQDQVRQQIELQSNIQYLLQGHIVNQRAIELLVGKPGLALRAFIDEPLRTFRGIANESEGSIQSLIKARSGIGLQIQEWIERDWVTQRRIADQLNPIFPNNHLFGEQFESYRRVQEHFARQINSLSEYLNDPLLDSVLVTEAGDFSVAGHLVDIDQIKESFDEITEENSGDSSDFFDGLLRRIQTLKGPSRIIFLYLMLPYLISIFANLTTPMYEVWWTKYADRDKRVAKKEIIANANSLYLNEQLEGHRFVYAKTLNVRSAGSLQAEVIDELYLGKTVTVIEKGRRWSLVEYKDSDSGEVRQGWVFSRYLKKFTK